MDSPQIVAPQDKYSFILFISGMAGNSVIAVDNLRKICDQHLDGRCDIRIIDLNREREMAAEYQIIAIPTLIKTHPYPTRTIIGDLSDTDKVLRILDLN